MKTADIKENYGGYELTERGENVPPEADFSLTVTDAGMEPYIKKDSVVHVKAVAELEEFDTGIFMYAGRVFCRQWCEDIQGSVHILCANPAFEKENLSLSGTERKKLTCLGKVLLKKKLPPPTYY